MIDQEESLTKFQLWTVMIADAEPGLIRVWDLATRVCESALDNLTEERIYDELRDLDRRGYVKFIEKGFNNASQDYVTGSVNGRLYVRRLHKLLLAKVETGSIPEQIVDNQNPTIRGQILNHKLDESVFRNAIIKHMPPLLEILALCGAVFNK